MEVIVRRQGGLRFDAAVRDHVVCMDQPAEIGGLDQAMTPPELFLSSLGACAAYYAEEYLRVRALPDEELEIRISAQKASRPARIVSLQIDVIAPGLTQKHRDGILRAVDACLLKHTLEIPPQMNVCVVSSTDAVEHEELVCA